MSRRALIICYIMLVWFVISFVTNLIGPLMPIIIGDFHLSLGLAGFLPFSFFLAYGLISIPAGALVEARGTRTTLLAAFGLNLLGCLGIALYPSYAIVICGLFVIGLGMAMLQVVINPLTRATGGEGHFAFFSVMGQLVFGLASYVSPLVFSMLMHRPGAEHEALVWVQFYWAFLLVFVSLIALTAWLPLPPVELAESERAGGLEAYRKLIGDRSVRLFFLGIIAYVGTEQSLANWMSQFLSTYHHFEPTQEGAHAVGSFWGLMSSRLPARPGPSEAARCEGGAGRVHAVGIRIRGPGLVRIGADRARRLSHVGILSVSHVFHCLFARTQLGEPISRRPVRHPVHRNTRRRRRAAAGRIAGRPVWPANRPAERVCDARIHIERLLLGSTPRAQ